MSAHDLNSADYARIEATLRGDVEELNHLVARGKANPFALRAMRRTLDKVERINGTGDYTLQGNTGITLKQRHAMVRRAERSAARKKERQRV